MESRGLRRYPDPSTGACRCTRTRSAALIPSGSVWFLAVIVAVVLLRCVENAHAWVEQPLVANIGHSLSASGPWSTAGARTVSTGTTIYFHALDSNDNPIEDYNDVDNVGGVGKYDRARYKWDWCYDTGEDTGGLAKSKTYYWPGNRTVRLRVYDDDGAGYTNDVNKTDTVTSKVKLTRETDWMAGYSIIESGVDEQGQAMTLQSEWARANHTLVIKSNHDTNCTYHEYILDELGSESAVKEYLDAYENRDGHIYLLGGDRFSTSNDPAGKCFDARLGMVYMGAGGGLSTWYKLATEIHEPACHDDTIVWPDTLGHCTSGDACCCRAPATSAHFCDSCIADIKQAIEDSS